MTHKPDIQHIEPRPCRGYGWTPDVDRITLSERLKYEQMLDRERDHRTYGGPQ